MQASDTTFPRLLDRGEAFFWFLDQVSPNNFMVIAEGSGPLPEEGLRKALARAQQEHPLLSACITAGRDGRLYFEQGAESPIPLTIAPAEADWHTQLSRFMVPLFALDEAPLIRVCRFDLADSGRWVFALVVHHSIADGRSAFQLLQEVLEHASGVHRPLRIRPKLPAMHDVFPPHLHGEAGEQHARDLKQLKRQEFKEQGKPDQFPAFSREIGKTGPAMVSFTIPAEQLARISERAKQENSSVNGAVGAAQLLALQSVFADGEAKLLSQVHATDLRSTLTQPIDHSTPGAYVAMVTSTQRVDGSSSFWEIARCLTHDIRRQLQRGDAHQFYRLMPAMESFAPTPEGIAAFTEMIDYWPLSNMLSNVGRLPELHTGANLDVHKLSFALCPNPSIVIFCTATTYKGQMTVNINYEKNRLDEAVLQKIAAVFERELVCAKPAK